MSNLPTDSRYELLREVAPDILPKECYHCIEHHNALNTMSPCRDCTRPRYPRKDRYRRGRES